MTRRGRVRLVVLAALALLCQQAAFAAYVCAPVDMRAADVAMSAHCANMPMPMATRTQPSKALCIYHCAHQPVAPQDAQLPSVPPSSLAAIVPAPAHVVALPLAPTAYAHAAMRRTPTLAPPLRHRVLLI